MAIESGSYISDLEPLNPASTDLLKQADDHLRLIKSVLKNTFPNIDGPVTVSQDDLNNPPSSIPVGAILLWYGDEASIPDGFALCDGTAANLSDGSGTILTPDLRDRIPMGVGSTLATLGETGGSLTGTGSTSSAGAHTHDVEGFSGSVSGTIGEATTGITLTGETRQQVEASSPSADALDSVSLSDPGHTHAFNGTMESSAATTSSDGAHTHTVSVDVLPPVLAVHYIMKV